MQEYASKAALIEEITKTAARFISEFDQVSGSELDVRIEDVDKTPREMIAYQLGWMELIQSWERDELAGKLVVTPAPGYKWNQMGPLYEQFYAQYRGQTLEQLLALFHQGVEDITLWLGGISDVDLFQAGGRAWAGSTPANWPVWKWVHINTVAPFGSFRSKIRKWKKLCKEQ